MKVEDGPETTQNLDENLPEDMQSKLEDLDDDEVLKFYKEATIGKNQFLLALSLIA
jgi:hypothetical protein